MVAGVRRLESRGVPKLDHLRQREGEVVPRKPEHAAEKIVELRRNLAPQPIQLETGVKGVSQTPEGV